MKNRHSSIVPFISLIVTVGFVLSGVSSFFSFNSLFKKDIEAVSQLTSENIYVSINDLMNGPINVSMTMAHDTLLRDLMAAEPEGGLRDGLLDTLTEYLTSYQKKYQFDSVFLISTRTGAYYHYKNGLDRIMTTDNPENVWYYAFLQNNTVCSLNVDNDETRDDNIITVFVNCRLEDQNGSTLAVVGVGMETPYIQQFLQENGQEYGVSAYLIDEDGNVQLSSDQTGFEQVNLFEDENFADMKKALSLRQNAKDQRWYHTAKADGYIITRYISNLNWYLVVKKSTEEFSEMMLRHLILNMLFLLCVLVAVIISVAYALKKYDRRLVALAEADQLTGIRNRMCYELELSQYAVRLGSYQSFGIGIFDLNNLKGVNDQYGHQAGDAFIKTFSSLLCATFDHCPVFRIGGDEFAVIFANIDRDEVQRRWAELSQKCEQSSEGDGPAVSAAFGCAFRDADTLNTVEKIFKAADDNMYQNKRQFKR